MKPKTSLNDSIDYDKNSYGAINSSANPHTNHTT